MGKLINGVWVDWIDKVKVLQKAVVVNPEGQLLALRRPIDAHSRPSCWDLPGGAVESDQVASWKAASGKGDANDILVRSITTEIAEETSLSPTTVRAIHAASGFDDRKGILIMAIGYACKIANAATLQLSSEHSEYKWVTADEFLQLTVGNDGGLIGSIAKSYKKWVQDAKS